MLPALLLVEFVDEFIYGAREAAWPAIRDDLGLTYPEVGLLLGLPLFVSALIEMPIDFLGDTSRRRTLILLGGGAYVVSVLAIAGSQSFAVLLAAFVASASASGAFVSMGQASMADLDPERREQNMARWTLAGSGGVLVGTFAIGTLLSIEAGWRGLFLLAAGLTAVALIVCIRVPVGRRPPGPTHHDEQFLATLGRGIVWTIQTLRRRDILHWLVLLEVADLVGDVFLGYLALYLVDSAGATPAQAAFGVGIWTLGGLAGDLFVVMLLERVRGLTYLRINGLATVVILLAFLTWPDLGTKFMLCGALGLAIGGRYAILEAQLYQALPGRSASVHVLNNVGHLAGSFIPVLLGAAAAAWGLTNAMWLLMVGPIAVSVGTWRAADTADER